MLFIALTMLGYVSYKQLPVELLPNAELPMLFVQVSSQQDMDPSYVESEIVIPLEGAISSIGGVDKIQSTVDSRQSTIQIDFKNTVNFKITSLRLQEKVNELAATFPDGFNVQLQKVDVGQMANNFMVLQVRGSAVSTGYVILWIRRFVPTWRMWTGLLPSISTAAGRKRSRYASIPRLARR